MDGKFGQWSDALEAGSEMQQKADAYLTCYKYACKSYDVD